MQARLERARYSDAQLLKIISGQVLKGNYINFSLLVSVVDSEDFRCAKVHDPDLKKAIAVMIARCDEKDAQGMDSHHPMLRGFFFQKGIGSDVKYAEAIRCYDKAILLDNPVAMNNRAYMYQHGKGESVDYDKAIALYDQAIALGDANAMNNRASMYQKGHGGPVDYTQAITLYGQAIALGNTSAMVNRASMHHSGQGGSVNLSQTINLYEQAARGGSDLAQKKLQGISISPHTAPILFSLLWDELVKGTSFSTHTLTALGKHCKKEVLERIKASHLGTSLSFLKQFKTNPQHPLAVIVNEGQTNKESAEFKGLMKQARSVLGVRHAFFHAPLPREIKSHIFSFIQPGINHDDEEEQRQNTINKALKDASMQQDLVVIKDIMEGALTNKPSKTAVYETLKTAAEMGYLSIVKQLSSYIKFDDECIENLCYYALDGNQAHIIAWLACLKTYSACLALTAEAQTPMSKIRVLLTDYVQSNFIKNLTRYGYWRSPYAKPIEDLLSQIDNQKINEEKVLNFLNAYQRVNKLQKPDLLAQIIEFLNEIIYVVKEDDSLICSV